MKIMWALTERMTAFARCLTPLATAFSPFLTIIHHMTADYDFALCVRSARSLLLSNTQVFKEL